MQMEGWPVEIGERCLRLVVVLRLGMLDVIHE